MTHFVRATSRGLLGMKCSALGKGAGALVLVLALSACAGVQAPPRPFYPAVDVMASGETAPVGTAAADAADDPAIWRNAANPAASLIVGTDKKAGLYVYGLDGKVRDFVAAGALNNVDLREVRPGVIVVAASDRSDRAEPRIALFALDGATGKVLAQVVRKGTGKPLSNDSQVMKADDVKSVIDGWAADVYQSYVKLKNR